MRAKAELTTRAPTCLEVRDLFEDSRRGGGAVSVDLSINRSAVPSPGRSALGHYGEAMASEMAGARETRRASRHLEDHDYFWLNVRIPTKIN